MGAVGANTGGAAGFGSLFAGTTLATTSNDSNMTNKPADPFHSTPVLTTANTHSSSNSASSNTPATTNTNTNTTKSSAFSWFSSKPKAAAEPEVAYQPPVVPTTSTTTNNASNNTMTSDSIDLDDFMSSFSKKSTQPASSTTSMGMNNNNSFPNNATMTSTNYPSQTTSALPFINSSSQNTPQSTSLPATNSTLSLEEQLKQTQLEIARLSGNLQTNTSNNTTANASSSSSTMGMNKSMTPPQSMGMSYNAGGMNNVNTAPYSGNSSMSNSVLNTPNSAYSPAPAMQQPSNYNHNFVTSTFAPVGNPNPSAGMPPYSMGSNSSNTGNAMNYSNPGMTTAAGYNNSGGYYGAGAAPNMNYGSGGGGNPGGHGLMNPNVPPAAVAASYGGPRPPAASGYNPTHNFSNYAPPQSSTPPTNAAGVSGFYSNYNTAGGNASAGKIGNLPTGYQPPMMPSNGPYGGSQGYAPPGAPPSNQSSQQAKRGSNVGSAFDFMN